MGLMYDFISGKSKQTIEELTSHLNQLLSLNHRLETENAKLKVMQIDKVNNLLNEKRMLKEQVEKQNEIIQFYKSEVEKLKKQNTSENVSHETKVSLYHEGKKQTFQSFLMYGYKDGKVIRCIAGLNDMQKMLYAYDIVDSIK